MREATSTQLKAFKAYNITMSYNILQSIKMHFSDLLGSTICEVSSPFVTCFFLFRCHAGRFCRRMTKRRGTDLRTRLPSRFLGVTHTDWPGSRMGGNGSRRQLKYLKVTRSNLKQLPCKAHLREILRVPYHSLLLCKITHCNMCIYF